MSDPPTPTPLVSAPRPAARPEAGRGWKILLGVLLGSVSPAFQYWLLITTNGGWLGVNGALYLWILALAIAASLTFWKRAHWVGVGALIAIASGPLIGAGMCVLAFASYR